MTTETLKTTLIILVLSVLVILAVLSFFSRRTRMWGFMVSAAIAGLLGLQHIAHDMYAGTINTNTIICLAVYMLAGAILAMVSILERQKIREEKRLANQKQNTEDADEIPTTAEETNNDITQEDNVDDEQLSVIEGRIADQNEEDLAKRNQLIEDILEWYGNHIVYFNAEIQKQLIDSARTFMQTGEIKAPATTPPLNIGYRQADILLLVSSLLVSGANRDACAMFGKKVFGNYFRNYEPSTIGIKLKGVKTMKKMMFEKE
jgi:hypothetical protein